GAGTCNIIYTVTGGCNGTPSASKPYTVTPNATINAFNPANHTRCQGAGTETNITSGSNTTGITYALDAASAAFAGNSIVAATGVVTYAAGWSGTTTITASAAGCNGPATTTFVETITDTPTINYDSRINPAICGGSSGSITISGLKANSSYTANFQKDSGNATHTSFTSNAEGKLNITDLEAAVYTNISVTTVNGCTSNNLAGPYSLSDPGGPIIAHGTDVSPTTCGGTDGSIHITGLANSTHYAVDYKKNVSLFHIADIVSDATGILTIGSLGAGSYANVSVKISANCTSNILTGPYVLNDPPAPTITTNGSIASVCYSTQSQTSTLAYTATTISPIFYNINWDNTANLAGLQDQYNTAFSFNSGGGSLTGIAITANTPAGTYHGILTIFNEHGCSNSLPVSITVNALPTAGLSSSDTDNVICSGDAVTFTGTGAGTGTYEFFVGLVSQGLASTTSTFTSSSLTDRDAVNVKVTNANGCASISTIITTRVNALPIITGILNVNTGSTTQLTGSGVAASSSPWTSASPNIAIVDATGLVTGVSIGTSNITYSNSFGCSKTVMVTVTTVISPVTDSGTAAATGGTAISNVAANDLVNGVVATLGSGGNATISTSGSWPTGITLNTSTGAIAVASGTVPGTYSVTYQLCDKTTPTANCATVSDQITVSAVINPVTDSGTAPATGGTAISNVASNDFVNGVAATLGSGGNATISTSGSWPTGITLNTSTGAIAVASGTVPGTYNVTYQLCDKTSPTANCATVTDQMTVSAVINPVTDNGTAPATGGTAVSNVAANDYVNGAPATLGSGGNATISTSGSWPAGITLNTSTGAISVANGMNTGTYSVTYQLCDKLSPVHCNTVSVTITFANTPPVITSDGGGATASISVPENSTGVTTVTAIDNDKPTQTLTYSISGGVDAAKFTINGSTGELSFITPPDFENPTDTNLDNIYEVTVKVTDSGTGNLADSQAIFVTVTNVNEAPVVGNITKTVNEGNTLIFNASDYASNFSDIDGNTLFKIKITSFPANGTLKLNGMKVTLNQDIALADLGKLIFTPDADWNGTTSFGWNGSDGSLWADVPASVSITVNPVNNAPTFTGGGNLTVCANSGAQTKGSWGTSISAGPANESAQVVTFLVSNDNNSLFTVQPAISTSGTLTFTPANGKSGLATVTVQLTDNGGTLNGGKDTSPASTFTINVVALPATPAAAASQAFCGSATVVNLTASAPSGVSIRWFATATAGTALSDAMPLTTNTIYYAESVNNLSGCISTSRTPVLVTIYQNPDVPSAVSTQSFCGSASVSNLAATAPNGSTLRWYASATGGTPLTATAALVSNTTYYAESVNSTTGCVSARIAVLVTILDLPAAPTGSTFQNFCGSPTVKDLTATAPTGSIVKWYAADKGGTELPASTPLVFDTPYFAESVNTTTGCLSATRSVTVAAVYPPPAPPLADAVQNFCGSATLANIKATVPTSMEIKWYTVATGGTVLPLTTILTTGTYYAESISNATGCISTTRTAVKVNLNAYPDAPIAPASQVFCGSATLTNLQVSAQAGTTVYWYTAATGGTALDNSSTLTTATGYYAEAVNSTSGCVSLTRTAVTATVNALPVAPSGNASQNFFVESSPKVSNLTVTGSNVVWYDAASGGTVITAATSLANGTTYYATQTVNGCTSSDRLAVTAVVQPKNPAPPANNPPEVSDISKTISQNQTLVFAQNDFSGAYTDADNDVMVNIRIESLPLHGVLTLNGLNIVAGQIILASDLNRLTFTPDLDYYGNTSFRWIASDGKDYAFDSATVNIIVNVQNIFIPKGFSPNGDGIDDYFIIKGADKYIVTLRVFNRWGSKVYESNHYKNDWDGASNVGMLISNQLPVGTYFYTANFNNGDKEIIGYLTINR
ncbi:MAG: gliding motility-associated C-terminal domain-containing protein, partial [Prolixibacteraceae bacterium]